MANQGKSALLLFTRSQTEEARAKDFSETNSIKSNRLIAGHLITHTEKIARKSGLPCFVITSAQQHGNTFGEKLSDAFNQVFDLGYEQVIAIGNDCPSLSSVDLIEAANKLETKNAILGPAVDGGLYLIGLNRKSFNTQQFSNLPWGTDGANVMLQQYLASKNISFSVAEVKEDIDFGVQLLPIIDNKFVPLKLRLSIRSIIDSVGIQLFELSQNLVLNNFRIYTAQRGPPSL